MTDSEQMLGGYTWANELCAASDGYKLASTLKETLDKRGNFTQNVLYRQDMKLRY